MDKPVTDWISERHLRVRPAQAAGGDLVGLWRRLLAASIPAVRQVTLGYESVVVECDAAAMDAQAVHGAVDAMARGDGPPRAASLRTVEIPVCYHPSVAPDLAEVGRWTGLSVAEVADEHAACLFSVRFLGFTPGFAYLDGLTDRLNVPRLPTPRVRVPAGSVAIAGEQAGIYPSATPGGWRIIGRTPAVLFDVTQTPPSLLEPGDRVRMIPIAIDEYHRLAHKEG